MTVDMRLEALYGKIELVRGPGKPQHNQLCIMSLVAFLAGERHSDHPNTASPVIRRFAVTINDQMPDHIRGQLKPFAPAIIGTRDDLDRARAQMLMKVIRDEVLPRIGAKCVQSSSRRGELLDLTPSELQVTRELQAKLAMFIGVPAVIDESGEPTDISAATADLLACCARAAPDTAIAEWYWTKAIDLLDRLCGIRHPQSFVMIDPERIARLDQLMARHRRVGKGGAGAAWAIEQVRRLLQDWAIPD